SDGTAADYRHRVTDFHPGFVQPPEYAGQGFDHGRFFEGHVRRNHNRVQIDNSSRDADVLRVGAIVEQEIFAKILLMTGAVKAGLAWGGIKCDNAHAFTKSAYAWTRLLDGASEFVTEEGGGNDHAGMVSALINLEVSAAGESDLDLDQEFALLNVGYRNFL